MAPHTAGIRVTRSRFTVFLLLSSALSLPVRQKTEVSGSAADAQLSTPMDMGPAKPKKRGRKSVKTEGAHDDEDEDASGFGSDGDSEDSDARQRRHEARRAEKAGDSVAGMLANEFKVSFNFPRFE
jgi:hypothetical protein